MRRETLLSESTSSLSLNGKMGHRVSFISFSFLELFDVARGFDFPKLLTFSHSYPPHPGSHTGEVL